MAKKKVTTKTVTITEEIIETNDHTHIICLLDKSGSMGYNNMIKDARGGVNAYIKKQKEKKIGKATISIYLFDDTFEEIYSMVDLDEAKELTEEEWYPQGMTRLYDSIGKTIRTETKRISNLNKSERPDKILFIITTDGEENDSKEYEMEQIKSLIKKQEESGWKFIYTAAGQDAFKGGTNIGISVGNTLSFSNTTTGYADYLVTLDTATTVYRSLTSDDIKTESLMADASKEINPDK